MQARAQIWIVLAVIISLIAGAALSHVIEPGVRIEKVTLAEQTPALKLIPAGPGPHPVALFAHGLTGSKETLFRYAEALTAAGLVCYDVDQPGHHNSAFEIYPESETNFFADFPSFGFLTRRPGIENGPQQFTFVKNDSGETTAVIIHGGPGLPDSEGKKLNSSNL